MADVVQGETVVALTRREREALTELFDQQDELDPALSDLNNQLQTL